MVWFDDSGRMKLCEDGFSGHFVQPAKPSNSGFSGFLPEPIQVCFSGFCGYVPKEK